MKKKSYLTDEDRALWKHATSVIEPHKKTEKHQKKRQHKADAEPELPPSTKSSHEAFKKKWHAIAHTPIAKPAVKKAPHELPAIAADVFSNIKHKKRTIDARLDLHGLTQDTAYRKAIAFIAQSVARGLKTVLIITGKGSASNSEGVLQKNLSRWLAAHAASAQHISGIAPAPRELGGAGAFIITLKKR
ncbi:MAG: Smr/MutS family protein [Alphaproteobacteria bacterium]|nr:Smr/MutS family protein [Alphaproteobacteria bacterium]